MFGELKREAEKRVKGYPNLDTMVALVQCPEDYKGVSEEAWTKYREEVKEKEKLSSVRRSGRKTKLTINLVGNIQW